MIREELLAHINEEIDEAAFIKGYWPVKCLQALRAVVELHGPKSSEYFPVDVCVACSPDIDCWIAYPCATIRAIQEVIFNGR
jgi:ribosomal protein L16 Arg81 hydroxylase